MNSKKTITSLRTAKSPLKFVVPALAVTGAAAYGIKKYSDRKIEQRKEREADIQAADIDIQKYKSQLEGLSTENLYAGVESRYKDVESRYKDITNMYGGISEDFANVYEEGQVATGAADYQRQMFQQSQADIMQNLQAAAGGSGVAGLAQQMARMGQQQSQQIAADLQRQETAANIRRQGGAADVQRMEQEAQILKARGAGEAEIMRIQGEDRAELMRLQGEDRAEEMRLAGAADARSLQYQKVQGMLAMAAGEKEAAELAKQNDKSWLQRTFSDRRLKNNIVFIKKSPSGLNIYNFEYKDSMFGEGVYQGVMSDEIPSEAVVKHSNGYDMVNYNKIDVDFIKIKD